MSIGAFSSNRTDPMFRKFENARDKLIAYEKTHKNKDSSEYAALLNNFKYYDKAAAEVKFETFA